MKTRFVGLSVILLLMLLSLLLVLPMGCGGGGGGGSTPSSGGGGGGGGAPAQGLVGGRVLLPGGAPAAGAAVVIGNASWTTETDENGYWCLYGLTPGPWPLLVYSAGNALYHNDNFSVGEGSSTDVGNIQLQNNGAGAPQIVGFTLNPNNGTDGTNIAVTVSLNQAASKVKVLCPGVNETYNLSSTDNVTFTGTLQVNSKWRTGQSTWYAYATDNAGNCVSAQAFFTVNRAQASAQELAEQGVVLLNSGSGSAVADSKAKFLAASAVTSTNATANLGLFLTDTLPRLKAFYDAHKSEFQPSGDVVVGFNTGAMRMDLTDKDTPPLVGMLIPAISVNRVPVPTNCQSYANSMAVMASEGLTRLGRADSNSDFNFKLTRAGAQSLATALGSGQIQWGSNAPPFVLLNQADAYLMEAAWSNQLAWLYFATAYNPGTAQFPEHLGADVNGDNIIDYSQREGFPPEFASPVFTLNTSDGATGLSGRQKLNACLEHLQLFANRANSALSLYKTMEGQSFRTISGAPHAFFTGIPSYQTRLSQLNTVLNGQGTITYNVDGGAAQVEVTCSLKSLFTNLPDDLATWGPRVNVATGQVTTYPDDTFGGFLPNGIGSLPKSWNPVIR